MTVGRQPAVRKVVIIAIIVMTVGMTAGGCRQRTEPVSGGKKARSAVDQSNAQPKKGASRARGRLLTFSAKERITTGIEGSGECGSMAEYAINLHPGGRLSGKIELYEVDLLSCEPKRKRTLKMYGKHFATADGRGTLKAGTIENGKKSGIFLDGSYQGATLSMTGSHNEGVIGAVAKMKIFVEDLPRAP